MFHLCIFLFSVILFFVLSPGILFTIPIKISKNSKRNTYVIVLVHALVFATVWHFIHKIIWKATEGFEQESEDLQDLQESEDSLEPPKPPNSEESSLVLDANIKWSEKHRNYEDIINYIRNNYTNIVSFNVNNNQSTENNDAKIILTDNNNPNGVAFTIKYDDKFNVADFEKFLNDKGYSKNNLFPIPSSLL